MPEEITLETLSKDIREKIAVRESELETYSPLIRGHNIETHVRMSILKQEIAALEHNLADVLSHMPPEVVVEAPPEIMVIEMQGVRRGPGRPRKIRDEDEG